MIVSYINNLPYKIHIGSLHRDYTVSTYSYADPLASGQRKRLLLSDKEAETLSKRPKNDATVYTRYDLSLHVC